MFSQVFVHALGLSIIVSGQKSHLRVPQSLVQVSSGRKVPQCLVPVSGLWSQVLSESTPVSDHRFLPGEMYSVSDPRSFPGESRGTLDRISALLRHDKGYLLDGNGYPLTELHWKQADPARLRRYASSDYVRELSCFKTDLRLFSWFVIHSIALRSSVILCTS